MAAIGVVLKQVFVVNGIPSLVSRIEPGNFVMANCRKAVVVIPGNPGIIRFYDCFLQALFEQCGGKLPVFGIQHAGKYNPNDCIAVVLTF